jgi:hypothetical protein
VGAPTENNNHIKKSVFLNDPKMSLPSAANQKRWRLFDFDAHWPEFLAMWNAPEAQQALHDSMYEWCVENAYDRIYDPATPLWRYSRTDYWSERMVKQAEERAEREGLRATFRRRMRDVLPGMSVKQAEDYFNATAMPQLVAEAEPRPGSLESLIVVQGKNFLSWPLLVVAETMFENQNVIVTEDDDGNDLILVTDADHDYFGYVFDMYEFYFCSRDPGMGSRDGAQPDAVYDTIVDLYHAGIAMMPEFEVQVPEWAASGGDGSGSGSSGSSSGSSDGSSILSSDDDDSDYVDEFEG